MRIHSKIGWLVAGTALAATAVLGWSGYTTARKQYINGVDRQLVAAAAALPRAVGDDYLARAISSRSLSAEEYDGMVLYLSDLADRSGVYYLYVFVREGDQVVHLATSASQEERDENSWPGFLAPYEEPPPGLLATFVDGQARFAEYADEFGQFRSVFMRHVGAEGRPYVVGVDVSLQGIGRDLMDLVLRYAAAGGLVAVLAGGIGILLARRIARPLVELSHAVDAWADRGFAHDQAVHAHLRRLAHQHADESGDLAGRFVDVQDRLQTYLRELTETTAAKQKLEHELSVAKAIQESLLPRTMPRIQNFEVAGWSRPANQTGGDYFDWLELNNGQVILTIGDVMGHGIGPALLAAAARAYARATLNTEEALDRTVTRINDLLHTDMEGRRFVTLVACLLDPSSRRSKLLAAGHGPVLFYCSERDEVDMIQDTQGLPLGVMDQAEYSHPMELQFARDDVLVLVSDGFIEWQNIENQMFGAKRVSDSVLASCREDPNQIIDRLRRDVISFTGGVDQADDTTIVVIRCTG